MVIGNGLLARAFSRFLESDTVCIFASGVSNSLETSPAEFLREKELIESTLHDFKGQFVYFSTTSITDSSLKDRLYVQHKAEMERLIASLTKSYYICRLSYVVGKGGNPNTIMNYLVNCIRQASTFDLWEKAERNFLDVDDVVRLVGELVAHGPAGRVMEVANPRSHSMPEVVAHIERFTGKKSLHRSLDKGGPQNIDTAIIEKYCTGLSRLTDEDYLSRLLQKYYSD